LRGQQLKIEPPQLPTFRLVEAPSGSIQDPQCSLSSVFVVVPTVFSLLLSQVKLVWEAFYGITFNKSI